MTVANEGTAGPAADSATTDAEARTDTGSRAAVVADVSFAVAIALVAAAGIYVVLRDRSWLPTADLAILEIQLRMLVQDPPLLGSYSRFGWSHPGPMFTYFMWLPWRLTGGNAAGLLLGMLLFHLAAVAIGWWAARRVSVAAGVLVTAGLLLVWGAGAPTDALLPWNPQVGLLLGGALIVLGWNAATRGRVGALLLLPAATVLVQAHVGAAFLVVAVCGAAMVLTLVRWGQADAPVPWSMWLVSVAISAVMWAPPVWEQLRAGGGNMSAILGTDPGPGLGLGRALTVVSDAFAVVPYWWSPTFKFLPEESGVAVWALLPVVALVVALVRRDPIHLRALLITAAAGAAAVISVWQVAEPFQYLVAWIPAVAVTTVALSLWVLFDTWRLGVPVTWAATVLLPATALAVVLNLVTNSAPLAEREPPVRAVVEAVADEGLADRGVHLVTYPAGGDALGWVPGVANELQRRGIPVSADLTAGWPASLDWVVPTDSGDREPVMMRSTDRPDLKPPAGWRVVVTDDPYTAAEWAERRRLEDTIADPSLSTEEVILARFTLAELTAGRSAVQVLVRDDSSR